MKKSSFVSAVLACLFVSASVYANDIDSSLLPEGVTVEQIEQKLTSKNGVLDLVTHESIQFEAAKVSKLRKCERNDSCYFNVIELTVYNHKNDTLIDLRCQLGIAEPNARPPQVVISSCKTHSAKNGWAYDPQVAIASAVEIPNAKYETKKSKFQK